MDTFVQKYRADVVGTLSGWDRLMIRGTLRALAVTQGMMNYLHYCGVLLKDFGQFVQDTSSQIKRACEQTAEELNRPMRYLPSSRDRKEELAQSLAEADGIEEGLVGTFTCVEPCMSYHVRRDRGLKKLVLERALRKCLHYYQYWMDRDFGLMHVRLQSWFPFSIQVCLNGRSWLARQMAARQMGFRQEGNCFTWLENVAGAQALMDQLLTLDWPTMLNRYARIINPKLVNILRGYRCGYYWSVYESEWASDVMFATPQALRGIYPALTRGAITVFDSNNVLRFLGKRPGGNQRTAVNSDYRRRVVGLRVKHAVGSNSVKMYDKADSVLRVETTINDPHQLKVYRCAEGQTDPSQRQWYRLRKGVVDLRRRAEISQKSNERYYDALAHLDTTTPLGELIGSISQPTRLKQRRVRGLRPWDAQDLALLQAVSRGEHTVQGFRNRDLLAALYGQVSPERRKQLSQRISQRLRLLRAHRLIRKIPRTHRYQLTDRGRQIITAILQVQSATAQELTRIAA